MNFNDIIERIEANDPKLIKVNFNNVQYLDLKQWNRLFKALEEKNDKVEELNAANW